MLKAAGAIEEYEAKADSIKESLCRELKCFMPACVLTVTAKAGNDVILTVVATDFRVASGSQVESAAMHLQTKTLDAISSVLGIPIEEPPAAPSVNNVEIQVTRLAPLPPPAPSPTSLPSSPPSKDENKDGNLPLWALLALPSLFLLLVAALVMLYRRQLKLSRDRANMALSRDRANFDLQMSVHVNNKLQRAFSEALGRESVEPVQREQAQADDNASLSSSVLSRCPPSLSSGRGPASTLPPGPPSSSSGRTEVEQEMVASATTPLPPYANAMAAGYNWVLPWCGASKNARAKRQAPSAPASAPRATKQSSLLGSRLGTVPAHPEPTAVELETFLADEDVVLGSGLNMQPLQEGAGAQSSGAALMVPASGLEEVFEPTEAELAAFLEDEEVALEIQSLPNILGCPSAWSSSEMIANANAGRQRVLAHREQEAVKSTPTPPEPEWLTAMSSSISSAAPERSAQLASASAPRVTELGKAAAVMAEREAKWAEWEEWEAKKAATTKQRLLLEQQRAVLQQRQRGQQQEKAMQRLEQQRRQQQEKAVQRLEQQQRRQPHQQKKSAIQRLLQQHPARSSNTSGSGTVQTLAAAAAAHALHQKQRTGGMPGQTIQPSLQPNLSCSAPRVALFPGVTRH